MRESAKVKEGRKEEERTMFSAFAPRRVSLPVTRPDVSKEDLEDAAAYDKDMAAAAHVDSNSNGSAVAAALVGGTTGAAVKVTTGKASLAGIATKPVMPPPSAGANAVANLIGGHSGGGGGGGFGALLGKRGGGEGGGGGTGGLSLSHFAALKLKASRHRQKTEKRELIQLRSLSYRD